MTIFKRPALTILTLSALTALLLASCRTDKPTATKTPATTNSVTVSPLAPGPSDAVVAFLTARMLEEFHYLKEPLDAKMSERFYKGYIADLDPRHENFLGSDLAEFDHFRTNLDKLTVNGRGRADLTPAFQIYQRLLDRMQQHDAYVNELLKQEKFKFTTNERYLADRHDATAPKDLDEAKQLWRQRLRFEYLQEKLNYDKTNDTAAALQPLSKTAATEVADTLTRRYARTLHSITNSDRSDVLQAYLSALTHAYDPHSDYMNYEHAQAFAIQMSLSLFGIGAGLESVDGNCFIKSLIAGGPASKQLKEKDKIIKVAQGKGTPVDVVNMEIDKVVQLIRGAKGTEVRLTIVPADSPTTQREVTLIRDEIKLEDQAAKARLIEMPDGHGSTNRLGVISIPSFYVPMDPTHVAGRTITPDVAQLITKLKQEKVSGIVLDLRFNPGGSLEEAIRLTGLFITNGPVVQVRSSDGSSTTERDRDPSVLYDGPLTVLVNRFSASASEILAAALQDYGRAVIIGDSSTHGKGTVQNVNPLAGLVSLRVPNMTNDPGETKITIKKFYRISGVSTQLRGVIPDIVLPDVYSYLTTIGESSLDNPLPCDTNSPADYNKMNLVDPYLADLHRKSDERIATNQDFAYMKQDIEQTLKLQADKTATLNEREALKELQKNEAMKKARDAEREARPLPPVKIYELTMRNVTEPGLPEPMVLWATNVETRVSNGVNPTNFAPAAGLTNAIANSGSSTNRPGKTTVKKALLPDPMLDEAERILEDYIWLLGKGQPLVVTQ